MLALAWSMIALGVLLAIGSIILVVRHDATAPKPPPDALQSISAPVSTAPSASAVADYTVPPTAPRYITIPAIGVGRTRVVKLGLKKNDAIDAPGNIYDTGWYDGSAKPGQAGAMFIYGHVSSWTANGVFYNLKDLKPGDRVFITRGDNKKFIYQVVSTKIYDYQHVDMNQVLSSVDSSKPGLNLMTCTGKVIPGTSEFNERLTVFTSLVGS